MQLDPDTYACRDSARAARLAAGGLVDLTRRVLSGALANGFALLRPPGHHAEADRAMGFCLFNNVAVAAAAARRAGARRILIVDWDLHHGNGTQNSFWNDPDVLYFSTHQFPFYPGTGAAEEIGGPDARGRTVNVPWPPGCGDAEYLAAFDRVLLPDRANGSIRTSSSSPAGSTPRPAIRSARCESPPPATRLMTARLAAARGGDGSSSPSRAATT